ncbi:MAG: hypothetical protein VX038_06180 [Verrucomicrobiota bacterium]|nr:hypothetical protein [Verrucomicrobiota bacterium]
MSSILLIAVIFISGCSSIRFCHEPHPDHLTTSAYWMEVVA